MEKLTKYKLPEDEFEGIEMGELPPVSQESVSYGIPIEEGEESQESTQVEEGQDPQDVTDLVSLPRKPAMVQCPHC